MAVPQAQLQALQQHLARRDFKAASELAEKLHAQFPADVTALKACVQVYARAGEVERAMEFAEHLLEQDPDKLGYVSNLARWALSLNDPERARAYYEHFLQHSPEHPRALFELGMLFRHLGENTQAAAWLRRALDAGIDPPAECLLQLALACADSRQEELAVGYLERLLAIDPNHQLGQFNLASLWQAQGRTAEAERLFERILERDPKFSEALVRLLYGRKTTPADSVRLQQAERRARRSSTPALDRESLNFALAKAYDDLGEFERAFSHARAANDLQLQRAGSYDAAGMSRLVDRSIAAVTPEWLRQPVTDDNYRPIFILGHFRSGSTLVEQILSRHSEAVALGEVDFFLRRWHQDKEEFWRLLQAGADARLSALAEQYQALALAMAGSQLRGIDKRPENLLFMGLIRKLFPQARFIHTRRNLLDNAVSVYFQQLNDLSRFGTSLQAFGLYDAECERLMAHWQRVFADAIHSIDYEALVTEPESEIRSLLAFLDLGWEPACLDFQANRNFVRTASLAQVREGIHSRSVGRSRNYLAFFTEEERAALQRA